MAVEMESVVGGEESPASKTERDKFERRRLIAHLGRLFSRKYDIKVIPSKEKGLWACGLDSRGEQAMSDYIGGRRDTLDDLPKEYFEPKKIIYDEPSAQKMEMEEITTLLHHEAGHAKYTDFRQMVEGQRIARDDGHLPTSFWIVFEGLEDPRINSLEGEESPAIDRQIRRNQGEDLEKRLTEAPLTTRPKLLQFTYNTFHVWLRGETIPELRGTDVGDAVDTVRPLIDRYFANTNLEDRKVLLSQIWDAAKVLEKQDIEDEKKKQVARQKKMKGQKSQGGGEGTSGDGKPRDGENGQGQGEPSEVEGGQGQGGSDGGEGVSTPHLPGGQDAGEENAGGGSMDPDLAEKLKDLEGSEKSNEKGESGRQKDFLSRLKKRLFGDSDGADKKDKEKEGEGESDSEESEIDLSQFTEEQIGAIEDAINNLPEEEKKKLAEKARKKVDDRQKKWLDENLSKTLKVGKNEETGEWEVKPNVADEKDIKKGERELAEATREVESEEARQAAEEQSRRQAELAEFARQSKERQEKIDMEKAGFDPDLAEDIEKYHTYVELENAMYGNVRNFRQAIEKLIPRKKEGVLESGFFSGSKFDRRELVRKAPVGNEQFWQRQVEKPIGKPRLFIGLLVDNSGSMNGVKMTEARKTMVFFARVCEDMGIPFMCASFGDETKSVKTFRQDFDDPKDKVKPRIIDATDASGGSTNLFEGVQMTIEEMNNQRRNFYDSHGLIFVITDGGANQGLVGQELQDYIEENRGRLTFKAFGLSGSPSERGEIRNNLNFYFGESNCAYPENFENLPDEAFRVLRTNFIQFQKYLM